MQVISDKLEGIELKVRQLASKLEGLQQDNAALLEENKKLRTQLSERNNAVGLLQEELKNSQQSLEQMKGLESRPSKKLKKDIERYIREIDKCIEWLNNT